jgi:phosphatidylserine decarboxylase
MNNFLNLLKLISFPIHKEGFKFILIFAIITIIFALLSHTLGLIGFVLTLWCIFFFRDPERITPHDKNILVSPADGVVTKVDHNVSAPAELKMGHKKFNRISVFLNVFNVHVNRIPVSGKITKINYVAGKFLSANLDEASKENERNSVLVTTKDGMEIIFVQIAGLVARRIVSDLEVGQEVKIGERYGIIRFGSRMDIYLPEEVKIKTLIGQIMIGGETIIAEVTVN